MKIKKVHIKNFRSIKDEVLEFPENGIVSIIGANNAGKSNFLRAIDLVLGESWVNGDRLEEYDYYCGDTKKVILIKIVFDNGSYVTFDSGEKWPEYCDSSGGKIYTSIKDEFPCTYLSAERSISKDTSFNKWSLMSKISKSFNKSINDEQKLKLATHFDSVKDIFNEVESFSNFERDFKSFFNEMQSDSPYKLDIDFKPFTPNNYFKTINILASDPNVGNNIDIEELGDGAKNLTIISLLRSYAKNFRGASGIIAIEEPEIYLHPQARKHLFEILKEIADRGLQVIYTTHDSNFLEIYNFESIRRIYKVDDEENEGRTYSKICKLTCSELLDFTNNTGGPHGNSEDKVRNFYKSISNYRLTEGFFSRLIILGEGSTEEITIPKYFETIGLNYNSLGISILGVGGKGEIPKYWRLFHKFGIPVICIFDNDSTNGKEKSNELISKCFNIPITDITENINLFKNKNISNGNLVILEGDFEETIEKEFLKNNEKEELQAMKDEVNLLTRSKSVKASLMVDKFKDYGFIPSFINELKILSENLLVDKDSDK
ncbi:AAA family ATPase [Candidatus Gracilibacteria bacterium 28_42_T64]|nr:AAA family ATPase [Candidatus Gracilibacteria bacterium 28_42_T64]